MGYIAHTPPKERPDVDPHGYGEHIREMVGYGMPLFDYLLSFSSLLEDEKCRLSQTLLAALMLHDMGKLDESIQQVFRGERTGRLPIDHIDAGAAIAEAMDNLLLGWLIRGHHAPGLPNKKTEKFFIRQIRKKYSLDLKLYGLRGKRHSRDKLNTEDFEGHVSTILHTARCIEDYKERQNTACGEWPVLALGLPAEPFVTRLLLSCLVDADHSSAACYSQNTKMPTFEPFDARWQARLDRLDQYIADLPLPEGENEEKRNILRKSFYSTCRHDELQASRLCSCSASVGMGKTTSVMAYLLRCAIRDRSNRIIIVAPFANIIDQTTRVLRKAVCLPDENPEEIVVAHHHKAEFSNKHMRQYAASWSAPIVVTTSVQFFETLAQANPTRLRRLHNIVGASVFVDESHACLPPELINISWYWMRTLSDDWGCNFVFSSGSMVEFWKDKELLSEGQRELPDIFPKTIANSAEQFEYHRVRIDRIEKSLDSGALIEKLQCKSLWNDFLSERRPSCLVILNTVQSAAVVARSLAISLGDSSKEPEHKVVLHLSTALAPTHRRKVLDEVLRRQGDSEWDNQPWYLVATSCVEAGVDLDFSFGFRETCSVSSFLQVLGRINRHSKRKTGWLIDFRVIESDQLVKHPGLVESADVFEYMWPDIVDHRESNSRLCTRALRNEFVRRSANERNSKKFLDNERAFSFQEIAKNFKLIQSDTYTVIVKEALVKKLEAGAPVAWQEIQENSVQLWMNRIRNLKLKRIEKCQQDDIYSWIDSYSYDQNFLGIMGGVLEEQSFFKEQGGVL